MVYNLSLINGTGLVPFISTVNTELMYGWYGNLALIAMFCIFLISFIMKTGNAQKSTAYSALFVGLFSILFRTMGLVGDITVLIVWIVFGLIMGASFLFND